MRNIVNQRRIILAIVCGVLLYSAYSFFAMAQYKKSTIPPPPATKPEKVEKKIGKRDSIVLVSPVKNTIPQSYDEIMKKNTVADLKDPSNITTVAEYDYTTNSYIIRTKLGDMDLATPFMLSSDEYNNMTLRKSLQEYYRQRNDELFQNNSKNDFNFLDMNFALGPLEKVFGPGGVKLKTSGSVKVTMGIKSNKTDNPALSISSRRKTYFDFDQSIQATVAASVGDKLNFNMTYNTDATFDFDSKNLKLQYQGKEDEIIKNIEAGNVSMTTGSSLIKGGTSLFGIKTTLQFGKLTATALVSQQNSESKTVSSKGGVQTTPFEFNCDSYDQNRHFFLSQFFYKNYDKFAAKLPYVSSGVSISRIEVWVTNKSGNYSESRNIVGFMDLAESNILANNYWIPQTTADNPINTSNNLLTVIKNDYPNARYIDQVTTALEPLSANGILGGQDYVKIESARKLSSSEYILNKDLGYISLKSALNSDEVLAVAYEYTYKGKVYQVGEFSGDITSTDQSLYLKLLKGTTANPKLPMWRLMMKNVYSLGAYSVQKSNFKLNIKYLSDTTGVYVNNLNVGNISGKTLLQAMNLDRLDSNNESNPDGLFDFIEGYTILSSSGKVIFPVAEPFGQHLQDAIGNDALAKPYVYKELYDSTMTVAKQITEKNKFVMTGEYKASSGSQINLNAMNVPKGSVVVTAGGTTLTENSDYTVDYNMGIVTIINESIVESGTNISVSLENQSLYSMQRKNLYGLDLNYAFSKDFNIGATLLHFSEKSLTEKVNIGSESINNTIWGLNMAYKTNFLWLTNLMNKIPTVNATAPSTFSMSAEFAQLVPHKQKVGSTKGSSYVDDFESSQTGIDLRSPYSWFLASTPYDPSPSALFPEASLSNDVSYGKNRALLSWYYIDRMFTQKNSTLAPAYLKNDLEQLSNPYVREINTRELFPDKELNYGETSTIQTLNLSFYPTERGPYNLDATNISDNFSLLYPEKRWGGIMRKMDNTNFETANIEYIQFWMMDPFLDDANHNKDGGDLYFNLGEISEDILKDGLKSFENGLPIDGNESYVSNTVWGKVSKEQSLTYAFSNATGARVLQDVGLDGLRNNEEFEFSSYKDYIDALRRRLPASTIEALLEDKFSPFNDPAGDNYHFYRGYDYDDKQVNILDRYKHYNGVEGNSLSPEDSDEPLYQSARSVPDVEDINQDNTLNEYERYFQYKVSIRPSDLVVGSNYITDKRVATVTLRNGTTTEAVWYQFKVPLKEYEKKVGSINDFSTIRFARMFMTGFKAVTHLRFATLELVRGEWRTYDYNLNSRGDAPAEGDLDVSVVNIEENAGQTPVNYVLPPGVTRIVDPGQSQITQLNEQSMSLKVTDLQAGDARAVYKNTTLDLRRYKRMQMFTHAEKFIDDLTALKNNDLSVFIRIGSDTKNNFYEYEIPLTLTPEGKYSTYSASDQLMVWPLANNLDLELSLLPELKNERNAAKRAGESGVSYTSPYSKYDPNYNQNRMTVVGNPSLSDIRTVLVGVRNNSSTVKNGTIWVDELKVTDFNEDGGWAAKANVNLGISDIATLNLGGHIETSGFGSVDQSLSDRRLDDYMQYNVAVQADLGRFLPEKAKLKAPIYYSYSKEQITPQYNPYDQDVKLSDALDAMASSEDRDSLKNISVELATVQSFSLSNVKFDVKSKEPMPWDPSNFSVSFSFNKQHTTNPTTTYENTNDYRGNLSYSYTPMAHPFMPFKSLKGKSKNTKFLKDWAFNFYPTTIALATNISRYYYENQTRDISDGVTVEMPVSVSKNFLWDRQLAITWNLTNSLSFTLNTNTNARIEEPIGVVNRNLFPDEYKQWKDTIMNSIKNLGTPWSYNQSFTASYKAPFNKISFLDFINATGTYNASYNWEKGATVDDVNIGNTISNQASLTAEGRFNFETLYNKSKYLSEINKRFSNNSRKNTNKKLKKFERTFQLKPDTTFIIKHNMNTKKVKVNTSAVNGKPYIVKTRVIDANSIEVLTKGKDNVKFSINELEDPKSFAYELGQHASRFAMLIRNVSVRYRNTNSMSIPLFSPGIGDVFGQSTKYGPMAPGLDFAFGFVDDNYVEKVKERGWLICDDEQTSSAVVSKTQELNIEVDLEPIRGLKIKLTGNRTDNRTNQIQFMYDGMPNTRTGSYTKTHIALATALKTSSANDGYTSMAFDNFISNIDIIARRLESQYVSTAYPSSGFLEGTQYAGKVYDSNNGGVNKSSSDVLIPAFIAAYSGRDAGKVGLSPFPSIAAILPNWRITYDGLVKIPAIANMFKAFTLKHAYQCTYSVGSFTSYLNWIGVDGQNHGFTLDETSGKPYPSSPYDISSIAITEKFAPLIGADVTMKNNITINAEYSDARTLTLNSTAGQVVEASTKGFKFGAGYKIANFNTFIKMKGTQSGVSNDLTLNATFDYNFTQALIRKIETLYTQATSGTRTIKAALTANYILSKRITIGAYFDHQINTPLVSSSAYPTTNTSFGISLSLSLVK